MSVGEGQSTAETRLVHLVKNGIHIMFITLILTESQHISFFQPFAIRKFID